MRQIKGRVNGKIILSLFTDLLSQHVRETEIRDLSYVVGNRMEDHAKDMLIHYFLFDFYWFWFGFILSSLAVRSCFPAVFYYLLSSAVSSTVIFGLSINSDICLRVMYRFLSVLHCLLKTTSLSYTYTDTPTMLIYT